MNQSTEIKAINLNKIEWTAEDGLRATFMSSRPGFGIIQGNLMLTRDGKAPSAWASKKVVAEQIIPYVDTFKNYTWMKVRIK